VSNLLLITDVARLRKIFGRLTDDKNIRLRVVNNLEKGGEEIAIEKPDIVFVQTHLSGLSADILLMHLKKQLGRKRSRFVLLATQSQTSDAVLKQYQGWLDTSAEDSQLLAELHSLLASLLSKPKKSDAPAPPATTVEKTPPQANSEDHPELPGAPTATDAATTQQTGTELQLHTPPAAVAEPSLEEQGITYAPRQRLKVYSEFNSSFDSAVNSAPEPESLEQAAPPLAHDWNAEDIDTVETKPVRSKRGTFLLWLAPVVIAVVVITYMQQRSPSAKPEPAVAKAVPPAAVKPAALVAAPPATPAKTAAAPPAAPATATQEPDRLSDKAVLNAIAESRPAKKPAPAASGTRLTTLPEFIPRYGLDKQFSADNPGWERYKGQVTEFKVLREAQTIKAIQVIDRGGNGVPESFMKSVLRQVTKIPVISVDSSEKKDGYEIQRGKITESIKVVFYRDENGGKLRAFVLTWQ
jgi:hypothetical protein